MSLEGKETEYLTVYPSLNWETQSIESKDSQLDAFNDLEDLFNELAEVHTSYIQERSKVNPDSTNTNKLGTDLIQLEIQVRNKLKSLTNHQFQYIEEQLNTDYTNLIKEFTNWAKLKLDSSNISKNGKATFYTLFEKLTHKVNELETFREQKLLPDQLRILRATATGVKSKLNLEVINLKRELEEQRQLIDKKVQSQVKILTSDITILTNTKTELLKELDENKSIINNLNSNNSELKSENEYLKRKVESLNEEISENITLNNSLETSVLELTNVETKLAKEKEARRQLQKTLYEKDSLLENTRASLENNLKASEVKHSKQLLDFKSDYEHQLELVTKDKLHLESQLTQYSNLAELINNSFQINQEELKTLYSDFITKQDALNQHYKTSVSYIKDQLIQIQQEIDDSKTIINDTNTKLNQLRPNQAINQTLHDELNRFESDTETDDEEDDTRRPRHFNPYQLAFVSNNQTEEREQISALEKTVEGLGNTIERLSKDLQNRIEDLDRSRENIEALNREIDNLRLPNLNFNFDDSNNMDALARNLGELFSREEKKSIPLFSGQSDGKLIHDWLKTCKKIGDNNSWDSFQRIRFFSDRLSGEAADWHESFMKKLPLNLSTYKAATDTTPAVPAVRYTRDNLPYDEWEKHFIDRFTNIGHIEKLRNKLQLLRQTSEQDVQSFIYNINNLYNMVNGEGIKLADDATTGEKLLKEENDKLRNQEKLKILLRGVLPHVKNEMWPRMPANANYKHACQIALEAEGVVISKQINETPGLNALVAGMTIHEEEQDKELKKQKTEIEALKHHLSALTLSNNLSQSMEGSPKLLAAVSADEQTYTKIRFDRSRSGSKEAHSGSEDRNRLKQFSRSPSPYTPRYNRDHRERPTQSYNNNNRSREDWRNRSQSTSRTQSLERQPQRFQNNRFRSTDRRPFNRENNQSTFNRSFKPRNNSVNRKFQQPRINQGFNNRSNSRPFTQTNTEDQRPVCYYCHKPGHQAKECRLKMKNQRMGERRFNQM
jgi:peptidoglycan hydrolase CwlO-like protein